MPSIKKRKIDAPNRSPSGKGKRFNTPHRAENPTPHPRGHIHFSDSEEEDEGKVEQVEASLRQQNVGLRGQLNIAAGKRRRAKGKFVRARRVSKQAAVETPATTKATS